MKEMFCYYYILASSTHCFNIVPRYSLVFLASQGTRYRHLSCT